MSALKDYLESMRGKNIVGPQYWCAMAEISDRLDALEQQGKPVAQDERGLDIRCGTCMVDGNAECDIKWAREHGYVCWQPQEQWQGGDDHAVQSRVKCKSCDDLRARLEKAEKEAIGHAHTVTLMVERVAKMEQENAELRDWNKAAKESVALASAEVSKLQAENAKLKRQLKSEVNL